MPKTSSEQLPSWVMEHIFQHWPLNGGRALAIKRVKHLLAKWESNRSEGLKQVLEDMGFTIDYSPADEGEPPYQPNQE